MKTRGRLEGLWGYAYPASGEQRLLKVVPLEVAKDALNAEHDAAIEEAAKAVEIVIAALLEDVDVIRALKRNAAGE